MGIDIYVHLLYGFRCTLKEAFENKILNEEIIEGDDYQLINDKDFTEELVEKHLISQDLKKILLKKDKEFNENWNIYILTSSQYDADLENSYMYLYHDKEVLYNDRVPDYHIDTIEGIDRSEESWTLEWTLMETIPQIKWDYNLHHIIEGSW